MSADQKQQSVLFVTRKWAPALGGMETYSHELSAGLRDLVALDVHALPGKPDGGAPGALAVAGFFFRSAWLLWRRRDRYDVVHFGDFVLFPLLWLHAWFAPQATRIVTIHGLDLLYGNRAGLLPAVYRRFVRWAAKRRRAAAHYIANSENTARIAREHGFAPVTSVALGVDAGAPPDMGAFTPCSEPRFCLFVGRIVARKGARWFAEKVLPGLPADVEFHVVGKPWDEEETAALRALPRVKLLGYQSDAQLAAIKQNACVWVMPNIPIENDADVEGFGLVALEAAASGVPLVASRLEGLREAVLDGETGFLMEPLEAAPWVAQITTILSWERAQRDQHALKAWQTVDREFSWHQVALATQAVYGQAQKAQAAGENA